jgi:hypothetical protein
METGPQAPSSERLSSNIYGRSPRGRFAILRLWKFSLPSMNPSPTMLPVSAVRTTITLR